MAKFSAEIVFLIKRLFLGPLETGKCCANINTAIVYHPLTTTSIEELPPRYNMHGDIFSFNSNLRPQSSMLPVVKGLNINPI